MIAIDVAILPPDDVMAAAVALSAALPAAESEGLRLDTERLPHITLAQAFVNDDDLGVAIDRLSVVMREHHPLPLRVSGGGQGARSVWMLVERTPALTILHERVMAALDPLARGGGTAAAFVDGDARERDVQWVERYRCESSFDAFAPHITLGHASQPPHVEPVAFTATTVALCHLGRFCTCRRVLRDWALSAEH